MGHHYETTGSQAGSKCVGNVPKALAVIHVFCWLACLSHTCTVLQDKVLGLSGFEHRLESKLSYQTQLGADMEVVAKNGKETEQRVEEVRCDLQVSSGQGEGNVNRSRWHQNVRFILNIINSQGPDER